MGSGLLLRLLPEVHDELLGDIRRGVDVGRGLVGGRLSAEVTDGDRQVDVEAIGSLAHRDPERVLSLGLVADAGDLRRSTWDLDVAPGPDGHGPERAPVRPRVL